MEFRIFALLSTFIVFVGSKDINRLKRPDFIEDEIKYKELNQRVRVPVFIENKTGSIKMSFSSHNRDHELNLVPERSIDFSKIGIKLVGSEEQEEQVKSQLQDIEIWSDKRFSASMAFNKFSKKIMGGAFKLGLHQFHINPTEERSHIDVEKTTKTHEELKDRVLGAAVKRPTDGKPRLSDRTEDSSSRVRRSITPITRNVEIAMICDYGFYSKFAAIVPSVNFTGFHASDVNLNLINYVAHIVSIMNADYATMQNSDIGITVELVDVVVLTTASAFPSITEDIKTTLGTATVVDAEIGLDSIGTWLATNDAQVAIPNYDHAMLLTGYTLYDQADSSTGVIGLAWLGKICEFSDYFSSSIVEVGYLLTFDASTAAHELGHNLGADHDASDGASYRCSDDNFVMAAYGGNSEFLFNRFQFSCCSQRSFYATLSGSDTSCLSTNDGTLTDTTVTSHISNNLPGEIYDADDQCFVQDGTAACGDWVYTQTESSICYELWCVDVEDSNYCNNQRTAAADGTTCDTGKWCIKGSCVSTSVTTSSLSNLQCNVSECLTGEFKCKSGTNSIRTSQLNCVDKSWVCDGEEDCTDGSDEDRCGECYLCSNNQCVSTVDGCSEECPTDDYCQTGIDLFGAGLQITASSVLIIAAITVAIAQLIH